MVDQGITPTLRERASSTAITVLACALVGVVTTMLLGLVVWLVQIFFGVSVPLELVGAPGTSVGTVLRPLDAPATGAANLFSWLLWALVVVAVWLAGSRIGAGTPGDAVMTLRPLTSGGEVASRGRNLLRTAVPVAAYAVMSQLAGNVYALALLALLWAPALVRADRRTAVDLLVGVVPRSLRPAKTGRSWPAQPAAAAPSSDAAATPGD